jgi:putative toxin-antitoxin system antitoxin component (TIGR02293 family)
MSALTAPTLAERTSQMMGGTRALGRVVTDDMSAHDVLSTGLPAKALTYLVENLKVIGFDPSLEKAVGLSYRTYLRSKKDRKHLSLEQSGRAWKFAEILARATSLLGSQEAAEVWLETPAIALDGRRPIDLLSTPAGTAALEIFMGRLEYGVYT